MYAKAAQDGAPTTFSALCERMVKVDETKTATAKPSRLPKYTAARSRYNSVLRATYPELH
jgi:xylulokinase